MLGKILGGTTLAFIQASVFLLLAPMANIELSLVALPSLALVLVLMGFTVTGLGFLLAWSLNSTQGFHAIMNLLLIPMWLLSGAVFPAAGAAPWVQAIMIVNPMTYGVSALRTVLSGDPESIISLTGEPTIGVSVLFMIAFGMLVLGLIYLQCEVTEQFKLGPSFKSLATRC